MEPGGDLETVLATRLRPEPAPLPEDVAGLPAAVLLPVVAGASPELILTRRTDALARHPGEISFPGGIVHVEDSGPASTALRETEEELGLPADAVRVMGYLEPLHTFVTGIWITPVVGWLAAAPDLAPSPDEIAEVIRVPIQRLADVEAEVEWRNAGRTWNGFAYEVDGHTVWGATARILHEFLSVVGMSAKGEPWPSGQPRR